MVIANDEAVNLTDHAIDITKISQYLQGYQTTVCNALEQADTDTQFSYDSWQHDSSVSSKMNSSTRINPKINSSGNHISGITATLANGKVFEHAGVGFSLINGNNLPPAATARNPELAGCEFTAVGVSLIVHPKNPYVPTTHANVRCFVAKKSGQPHAWWFGGGFDLTPYYPFLEDCEYWHTIARDLCDPFDTLSANTLQHKPHSTYNKFKSWCDEYFYLPHRKETRGVGGIFFDDLNCWPFATCFKFMQAVASGFIDGYIPIVNKRKTIEFTQQERDFQLYRRGRYVEFNLLYDRGTLFGLQSNGRTESILMSLPPEVNWRYNWQPEPGSKEANLTDFLQPRAWI